MPTITEYAARLAATDTGEWRDATVRATQLWPAQNRWNAVYATDPEQEIPLRAAALVIHALAGQHAIPPAQVTAAQVVQWIHAHRDDWTGSLSQALRACGHEIPEPAAQVYGAQFADPVTALWVDLTEWRNDPAPWFRDAAGFLPWPGPNLGYGLNTLAKVLQDRDR